MENKQILGEIKFAFENGFTKVTTGTENDGAFYILGSFGYIATSDQKLVSEILTLVESYTTTEKTEIIAENLTTKEKKVLESLINNTCEYGLPVEVDEIHADTKMSKRSIVGVISSLYKKGIVEEYDVNDNEGLDEFMLTEKAFNELA